MWSLLQGVLVLSVPTTLYFSYNHIKNFAVNMIALGLVLVSKNISRSYKAKKGRRIPYTSSGIEYEAVIPLTKVQTWTKVLSYRKGAENPIDITKIVTKFSGPDKNFMGIQLKPSHFVRRCEKISFIYEDKQISIKYNDFILFE
jgi:hypothetical protein